MKKVAFVVTLSLVLTLSACSREIHYQDYVQCHPKEGFSIPLSLRTGPQTGMEIRSLKAGFPVFINRGSSELLHLGCLPV